MESKLFKCEDVCTDDSCLLSDDVREGYGDNLPAVDLESCRRDHTTTQIGRAAFITAIEDGIPVDKQSPSVSVEPSTDNGDKIITYYPQSP